MFAGNTNDASTLPEVLADLAGRFAVGRICIVADRGLVSSDNLQAVAGAGFDHVLAARLRRDRVTGEALEAIDDDTAWVEIPQHRCRAAEAALSDGTRAVVIESDARARRDTARTAEVAGRSRGRAAGPGAPRPRRPPQRPRQDRGSRAAHPRLSGCWAALRCRDRTRTLHLPLQRASPRL